MKTIKMYFSLLLCVLFSTSFAQSKNDSGEETIETSSKTAETHSSTSMRSKASMGYHHGNYKHPLKAKKATPFYKVNGHINKKAHVATYKMPHIKKVDTLSEKVNVSGDKKNKVVKRNYKRPFSKQ